MTAPRPRLTARRLPAYSYVPGHSPHPVSNPAGHMHGLEHSPAAPLNPVAWQQSEEYLYGIDLFNHGYYWEAHEAWEALWLEAGRRGPVANFLKGLIKLAAAGVKVREGNAQGASRHAGRARELFGIVGKARGAAGAYCGLSLSELDEFAQAIEALAAREVKRPRPDYVLDHWLDPKP